jgi:hypothetical protein
VATPEVHKQRIRQEVIGEIVDLMEHHKITPQDILDYKGVTKSSRLHEHRERASRIRASVEALSKARETKRLNKEAKQSGL